MRGIIVGFVLLALGVLSFFKGVFDFNFGFMMIGIVLLIVAIGVFIGSIL